MMDLVRFAPVQTWEPAPLELPIGFPDGPRSQPPLNHESGDEFGRVVVIDTVDSEEQPRGSGVIIIDVA
jgi:hypothetical protein